MTPNNYSVCFLSQRVSKPISIATTRKKSQSRVCLFPTPSKMKEKESKNPPMTNNSVGNRVVPKIVVARGAEGQTARAREEFPKRTRARASRRFVAIAQSRVRAHGSVQVRACTAPDRPAPREKIL